MFMRKYLALQERLSISDTLTSCLLKQCNTKQNHSKKQMCQRIDIRRKAGIFFILAIAFDGIPGIR